MTPEYGIEKGENFLVVTEEVLLKKIKEVIENDLDADGLAHVAEHLLGGDINYIDCAYRVYSNPNYGAAFGPIPQGSTPTKR